MKRGVFAIGLFMILAVCALVLTCSPGEHHLREFDSLKANFNTYHPSLSDRLRGIRDRETKWDYHLRKLEQLGVVEHTNLVFSSVPYTQDSSKHLYRMACSNFPAAVMFSATYYDTNDPRYGVRPYALEVWDFPTNMQRWSAFVRANNH